MESWDIESLSEESMYAVEADAYWMLCKLLDGIQDHYTNAQPGIQRTVFKLKELVRCGHCCLLHTTSFLPPPVPPPPLCIQAFSNMFANCR